MLAKVREAPSQKTCSRIIAVVKQVFTEQKEAEDEEKPTVKARVGAALGSAEYLRLLEFYTSELPEILLKLAEIKEFSRKADINKIFKNVSNKHQMLLKSYSANFTRILMEALTESNLQHIAMFFTKAEEVAKCVLPFKVYSKKLGIICARVCAMYSRVDQ